MPAEVIDVVRALAAATEAEQISWRRTDDPGAFVLARSQGAVVIWDTGKKDPNNADWALIGIRFLDPEGDVVYEYVEGFEGTDMDPPLQRLFLLVAASTSEVGQAMSAWLEDLNNMF